jgi:hypothetical protein
MDETEWLTSRDGQAMLRHLVTRRVATTKAGRRRLKLFTVGCVRLVWDLVEDQRRPVVELFEREADGLAASGDARRLAGSVQATQAPIQGQSGSDFGRVLARYAVDRITRDESSAVVARRVTFAVARARGLHARMARIAADGDYQAGNQADVEAHHATIAHAADLLREIFGNPFRPPPARKFPAEVRGLAQACYDDPTHYPVLADALDDLGEAEAAAHCRLPSHAKGCHVVDWILGRA